jgi:hypothetical protein
MIVDRAPLTPEAESLAPPLRGPKHAPFARFRVLLLVVRDSKAEAPRRGLLHSMQNEHLHGLAPRPEMRGKRASR